jgi:hypothetical protein
VAGVCDWNWAADSEGRTILRTTRVVEDSFCDLPEITEEALVRELAATAGAAAADVGPFYKQYRCILGFVAQTCYVYVPPTSTDFPRPPQLKERALPTASHCAAFRARAHRHTHTHTHTHTFDL